MADPFDDHDWEGDMEADSDDDMDFDDVPEGIPPPPLPLPTMSVSPPMRYFGPYRAARSRENLADMPFPGIPLAAVLRGAIIFAQNYRVMSVRHLGNRDHQNLETGGKVILPPSALQQLSRNSSALLSPMMFKATKKANQKFTHCGVLEFIAEEDLCYMPSWMMENIGASDNDFIQIERVELPVATFAKFQPQSVDFLEISNPKAILENSLRYFACLTKGDIVSIYYNSRVYKLGVLELLPGDAVNIIECDMNVDFAEPIGYTSPSNEREDSQADETSGFLPFAGGGQRLNGKVVEAASENKKKGSARARKGAPDTDWKIGTLQFKRKFSNHAIASNSEPHTFTAFGGTGLSLKSTKKRGGESES